MSAEHGARSGAAARLARYVPAVSWVPGYRASWLRSDVIAGFTIWGLLVPEGIAYASLAGLPPQAGLYTLLASLVLYAVFGTSRQLVVAGTSASAVLGLDLDLDDSDGGPALVYKSKIEFFDDGPQKPVRIWSRVGRRPVVAGGNSNGDIPMMRFARAGDGPARTAGLSSACATTGTSSSPAPDARRAGSC
jgi:hypothetical protein